MTKYILYNELIIQYLRYLIFCNMDLFQNLLTKQSRDQDVRKRQNQRQSLVFKQTQQQAPRVDVAEINSNYLYKTILRSQSFHKPTLDPRDHKILISYEDIIEKVYHKNFSNQFQVEIRSWLVRVYQTVSSDTFMKYLKKQLSENQMKAYFAKNILMNVCFLMKDIGANSNEQFQKKLVQFINSESKSILSIILLKYPQVTNPSEHLKLKSIISRYDNRDKEQFDILKQPQKFGIVFQVKENADYSTEIMRILDYLIKLPNGNVQTNQETKNSKQKYTFMEIFKVTLQGLCMFAGNKVLEDLGLAFNQFIAKSDDITGLQFFDALQGKGLQDNSEQEESYVKSFLIKGCLQLRGKVTQKIFQSYNKQIQKKFQQNQKNQAFQLKIGQKIAPNLEKFTQQQIQAGAFRVCDSSVLRVMTKWTQELRDKIKNARQEIYKRVELFKTTEGELIQVSAQFKQIMFSVAQEKQKRMKKIFNQLKNNCHNIQRILANQYRKSKHINDIDGNIGSFAAKIQACIGQYLFEYLNQLFHALLQIPKEAAKIYQEKYQGRQRQVQKYSKINLISFKIGDLLRGKYKSSQKNVIKVYKFIQKISQKTPWLFRIIRVKDRLDQKDSDILINLYYMNRIQCQLQLEVKSKQVPKQNQYNYFNHLIYQLKRADFGPITECASILAKYDHVVKSYAKSPLLQPNFVESALKSKIFTNRIIKTDRSLRQLSDKDIQLQVIRQPFICSICQKFKIINNPNFFKNRIFSENFKQCHDCFFERMMEQSQQTRKQVYKQLFIHFCTNKNQMNMILKHFYLNNIEKMKDIETFFKEAKKGFIIFKNEKIPKPKFYQLVKFQDEINIFIEQDRFSNKASQYGGKIIQSINIHNPTNQWKSKLQQKAYFFAFSEVVNSPVENVDLINQIFLASKQSTTEQKTSPQNSLTNACLSKILKNKLINQSAQNQSQQNKQGQKYNSIKCQCCRQKQIILGKYVDPEKHAIQLKNLDAIQTVRKKRKSTLFLADRRIISLLSKVKILDDVKRCYLFDNQIKKIDFPCLKNVKYLNLDNNKLVSLKGINELQNLEALLCNANMLDSLKGIQYNKKIQILMVNQNYIDSIQSISKLSNLRHFQCSFNGLENIQPLKRCTKISVLKISNNKISDASSLQSLKNLQILNCRNNKLEQLILKPCQFLHQLNCSGNSLIQLELYEQKILRNLNFQRNRISSLKGISECHLLQILQCSQNCLQSFKGLEHICLLKTLVCCNNRIKSFRGLQNCMNLEILSCGNKMPMQEHLKKNYANTITQNYFITLNALQNCQNLKALHCEKVGLQTLNGIEKFQKLEILNAPGNNIKQIQKLQQLQQLKQIDLTGNMLTPQEKQRLDLIQIKNKDLVSLFYFDFNKDFSFDILDAIRKINTQSIVNK